MHGIVWVFGGMRNRSIDDSYGGQLDAVQKLPPLPFLLLHGHHVSSPADKANQSTIDEAEAQRFSRKTRQFPIPQIGRNKDGEDEGEEHWRQNPPEIQIIPVMMI